MNILSLKPVKIRIQMAAPPAVLMLSAPTVKDFYRCFDTDDPAGLADELLYYYGGGNDKYPFTAVTAAEFIKAYRAELLKYREDNIDLCKIPTVIDFRERKKDPFPIATIGQDLVYRYSGLNFREQCDLDIIEFWIIMADAFKTECEKSDKGREFLENAYNDMHKINTLEANLK